MYIIISNWISQTMSSFHAFISTHPMSANFCLWPSSVPICLRYHNIISHLILLGHISHAVFWFWTIQIFVCLIALVELFSIFSYYMLGMVSASRLPSFPSVFHLNSNICLFHLSRPLCTIFFFLRCLIDFLSSFAFFPPLIRLLFS